MIQIRFSYILGLTSQTSKIISSVKGITIFGCLEYQWETLTPTLLIYLLIVETGKSNEMYTCNHRFKKIERTNKWKTMLHYKSYPKTRPSVLWSSNGTSRLVASFGIRYQHGIQERNLILITMHFIVTTKTINSQLQYDRLKYLFFGFL